MKAAVFLDRDGVLNRKRPAGEYVTRWDDFTFEPGARRALATLRRAAPGVPVYVVTNQRGIARGLMSSADVASIHAQMRASLRRDGADVDGVEVCPHEAGACDCRKPAVGLFRRIQAQDPEIDLARSVVVGDSLSDLEAGFRLGARVALVGPRRRRDAVRREAGDRHIRIDAEGSSLADLVDRGPLLAWVGAGATA